MADQKLTTVYHPLVEDMQADVPSADVDAWAEQGWKKSKPKSAVAPEEEPLTAKKAVAKKAAENPPVA